MTYANAYKMLNKSGEIDRILSDEVMNGANFMIVKKHICDGIDYYCDFTKSTMFKEMKYWQDDRFIKTEDEKLHHRIVNRICKKLAEIEIEECSKKTEMLKYLINSQI